MEIVKITELTKKYGDVIAVDNISLEIEKVKYLVCWGQTGRKKKQ